MSFALTEQQIIDQTKFVTRRHGWDWLACGDLIQPVRKGMGLRAGETVVKLGPPIRVVNVRFEALDNILKYEREGRSETFAEGFPTMSGEEFIEMFGKSHRGVTLKTIITRIEFIYTKDGKSCG
jgi:hypothetical protein